MYKLDASHLAERVDPGIGPSRAHDRDRGTLDLGKRRLETLLNRRSVRLPLPTNIPGALVGEGKLQAAHHDALPSGPGTRRGDRLATRAQRARGRLVGGQ